MHTASLKSMKKQVSSLPMLYFYCASLHYRSSFCNISLLMFFSLKFEVLVKVIKKIHVSLNFAVIFYCCAYFFFQWRRTNEVWCLFKFCEKAMTYPPFIYLDAQAQGNQNVPVLDTPSKSCCPVWIEIIKQELYPNSRFQLEVPKLFHSTLHIGRTYWEYFSFQPLSIQI